MNNVVTYKLYDAFLVIDSSQNGLQYILQTYQRASYLGRTEYKDTHSRSTSSFPIINYLGTFMSFLSLSSIFFFFHCPHIFIFVFTVRTGYLYVIEVSAFSKLFLLSFLFSCDSDIETSDNEEEFYYEEITDDEVDVVTESFAGMYTSSPPMRIPQRFEIGRTFDHDYQRKVSRCFSFSQGFDVFFIMFTSRFSPQPENSSTI